MRSFLTCLGTFALLLSSGLLADTDAGSTTDPGTLAERVEELRLQSVNLARDIWLLEQQLGDEDNRLVIFVSMDPRLEQRPEYIELKLGDEIVARHDYSPSETVALSKGGAHRVYAATLEAGRHVLEAQLRTRGPDGKLRQSTKLSFRSGEALKTIELRLQAAGPGLAELTVREWD